MLRSRLLPAILALAASLSALGCGDGGVLSRTEFVARGDELCREVNDTVDRLPNTQDPAVIAKQNDEIYRVSADALEQFKELKPPAEIKDKAKEYVNSISEQTDLVRDSAQAARKRDRARYDEVSSRARRANKRSDALAREIGFKACGKK